MNCCVHAGMNHLLLKQIAISLGRNCHIHLWQVIYASGVMQFGALLKGKEEEKKNQLWHPLAGTTVRYSSMHGSHGNSAIGKNFSFEGETEVRRWQAFREGWRCHKALTWESGRNFTFSIYFFLSFMRYVVQRQLIRMAILTSRYFSHFLYLKMPDAPYQRSTKFTWTVC